MTETKSKTKKSQRGNIKIRAALLILQVLLPFGMYFTITEGQMLLAGVIAGTFTLSMAVLLWLG